MEEIWKPIKNYEGYYEVSNKGRVKSLIGWNGKQYIEREKILKPSVQQVKKDGNYKRLIVNLYKDKKRLTHRVHRLVIKAFLPNPEDKESVNHIDCNPFNNELINLEWCTAKENSMHAMENGLCNKIVFENEKEIFDLYNEGVSIQEIKTKTGYGNQQIRNLLTENGFDIRSTGHYRNKYNVDRVELVKDFESGMKNTEIAIKHKTNTSLIASYKYKHKKGELL